jgi:membrane-bound lytic murein transglycosylase D
MRRLSTALAAILLLGSASAVRAASGDEAFPRPYAIHPQIRFWTRVYTEVDTSGGFVHDAEHLDVVYEAIRLPDGLSGRAFQDRVDERKTYYRRILNDLADGKREGLSDDEQRVLQLWPTGASPETLRGAADSVRFQLGQADRFREGIERSGRWEAHIARTLEEHGVPRELAALPHVESSYNPQAYSHAGAAGLWQFMRSTGKRFMHVDDVVDERFDPWRSSEAAARFLAENRRITGTWPLAVTSYNHGAGGMKRAAQALGTQDIGVIVRRYKSPSFGFASRNFYTSFLAALDVSREPERYFGAIRRSAPEEPETLVLARSHSVGSLQRTLSVDLDTLREYNLALRTPFWIGRRYAPAGYALRLPPDGARAAGEALASAPAEPTAEIRTVTRTRTYRVKKGDTIAGIARRFDVSERTLVQANHLDPRRLRAGEVLRVPQRAVETEVAVERPPAAAPTPPVAAPTQPAAAPTAPRSNELASLPPATESVAPEAPAPAVVEEVPPAPRRKPPAEVARAETKDAAQPAPELERANPARYRVDAKGYVSVQPDETIGHYARWLGVPTSRLLALNGLKKPRVPIGKRLKLDFSKTPSAAFEQRRLTFHQDVQREFFDVYRVAGTEQVVLRKGDTLWGLSRGGVPVWLLHHYNPDLDLAALRPGVRVTVPRLSPKASDAPALPQGA